MFDITDAFETAEAKLAEVFTKEFQIPDLGYAFGVATWCFWLFLGGKVMFKFLLPREFKDMPHEKLGEWANRFVALVVCVTMSFMTSSFWAEEAAVRSYDDIPKTEVSDVHRNLILGMMGYMIYDVAICLFVETELSFTFLAHHFAGLFSHLLVLGCGDGLAAYYSMAVYVSEGSTPFYHLAWMLNELQNGPTKKEWTTFVPNTVMALCSGLFLVCFFLFRVVVSPMILWHSWTVGFGLWSSKYSDNLAYTQLSIIAFFVALNYYWFYTVVKAALAHFGGGAKEKSQ